MKNLWLLSNGGLLRVGSLVRDGDERWQEAFRFEEYRTKRSSRRKYSDNIRKKVVSGGFNHR